MKYFLVALTLILTTGCSLGQRSQIAYRVFSMYRETDGTIPMETESDIPNSFECIEDYDFTVAKDAKGEDIWADYELVNGEKTKVFRLNSEHDILLEVEQLTEADYIDELRVKYLCVSSGLLLNGLLGTDFSNYTDSRQLLEDVDLYMEGANSNQ